jgi:hypothetical protein
MKKIFIICASLLSIGLIGCDKSNKGPEEPKPSLSIYWGQGNDLLASFTVTTSQIKCTLHNIELNTSLESSNVNACFFDHSELVAYPGANDITISDLTTDKELMTASVFIPEDLDFKDVLVWNKKANDQYMITIPYQPSSEDRKNNQIAYGYAIYNTYFLGKMSGQDAINTCRSSNGWKLPVIGDKYDSVEHRGEASYNTLLSNSMFKGQLQSDIDGFKSHYLMSSSKAIDHPINNGRDSFESFKEGEDYYGNYGIDAQNRGGPGAFAGWEAPFVCVREGSPQYSLK